MRECGAGSTAPGSNYEGNQQAFTCGGDRAAYRDGSEGSIFDRAADESNIVVSG